MPELPIHLPTFSLLVRNMHCPSCCEAITQLLSPIPAVRGLSVSLLLRTITFSVDPSHSSSIKPIVPSVVVRDVNAILTRDGGFEVHQQTDGNITGKSLAQVNRFTESPFGRVSRGKRERESKVEEARCRRHLEHCKECRDKQDIMRAESHLASLTEASVNRKQPLSSADDSIEKDGIMKTVISIKGMTCASCTSSITFALQTHTSVLSVSINLLSSSGTVRHQSNLPSDELLEMIEDVGFAAEIIGSNRETTSTLADKPRLITIRVKGVFCGNCITQINNRLATLPLINHTFVTLDYPVSTISYFPRKPLTVRTILDGLSSLAPEFEAEVVRSQSMSERSQKIQRKEVKMLSVHLAVAFIFAIPTFIIAIVGMILVPSESPFKHFWMTPTWGAANLGTVILWPLATAVQFGVGRLFYCRAFNSMWPHLRRFVPSYVRPRSLHRTTPRSMFWRPFLSFGSMDLLVVLSTTASYFASVAMLVLDVLSASGVESVGTYFDSCVFLIMFILLGRTLEAYSKSRTTDAVSLLGLLRPEQALLIEDQRREQGKAQSEVSTRAVPVDQLEHGDHLIIQPGSLPPADGSIISGTTTFDESSLTGESRSITKGPGDEVFTGTTNKSSAVTMRVTHLASETMLEKIIAAVADASARKAPIEKLAEKLTGVFVPIIVYLSIIVLAVWIGATLGGAISEEHFAARGGKVFFAIEFAIATLVVACPCGIGLAVPCANAVGNGIAARAGILATGGGQAFLAATKVKTIAFDKTGTLTVGKSVVRDEEYMEGAGDRGNLRRAIREVEALSTHPLAVGLVEHLDKPDTSGSDSVTILSSDEQAGRGIQARVEISQTTFDLLIGNVALMLENSVSITLAQDDLITKWSDQAESVVLVAVRVEAVGGFALSAMFSLSDPPRDTTASVLAGLRNKGYNLVMLSGDNEKTARAVGRMVGIGSKDVRAGVDPEGKADFIRDLQVSGELDEDVKQARWWARWRKRSEPHGVMFVGDGLNDSVALAAADVSVAMGHGSQATLASADFVLLNSSLDTLLPLLQISKKVYNRQRLNLLWAVMFNVVCIPFACGVFYPANGIRLTPVWSAILMALSSVSVVCSSLALRWGL